MAAELRLAAWCLSFESLATASDRSDVTIEFQGDPPTALMETSEGRVWKSWEPSPNPRGNEPEKR